MQGKQSQDDVAASVIPVRLRGGVVALESSFRGGIKREVLRSLCQASTDLCFSPCRRPEGLRPHFQSDLLYKFHIYWVPQVALLPTGMSYSLQGAFCPHVMLLGT